MSKAFMFLLAALGCVAAVADQLSLIPEPRAEEAAMVLRAVNSIRHFCEPCGDVEWREETVTSVDVRDAEFDELYEVMVNSTGIDLAYVYIPQGGRWQNLAMHLNMEVDGVSEYLPEAGEEAPAEVEAATIADHFTRTQFLGEIGGLVALLDLQKQGTEFYGSYSSAAFPIPVELRGEMEASGAFELKEYGAPEGELSAIWRGSLDPESVRISGARNESESGAETSFTFGRAAVAAIETAQLSKGAIDSTSRLVYPSFLIADESWRTELNSAVRATVLAIEDAFRTVVADAVAGSGYAPPTEMASPTIEMDEYELCHLDERLMSLMLVQYEYSGGAHGNSITHTVNVRKGGGLIKVPEIFGGDQPPEALSTFVLERLREQNASLVVDGELSTLTWDDLSQFSFSREGFRFYFDPYHVASYAEGSFEVRVPFAVLQPLMQIDWFAQLLPPETAAQPSP